MTPEQLTSWLEAAMPILAVALSAVIVWRIPWRRFFAWISAPTMASLVFVSAFCIAAQSMLSSESVYKYWNPYLLEFAKFFFGTFGGGFVALKAYRMTPEEKEEPKP